MWHKLGLLAMIAAASASPLVLKQFEVSKIPLKPSEYAAIQPDDAPYGQNCTFKGKIHDQEVWECWPNGRGKNDLMVMGISLDMLPEDVLSWAANTPKPKH